MRKDKKGTETISGVFQGSGRGYGFLSPEGGKSREDDWFLPPGSTGGAWHGDSVLAEPVEEASGEGKKVARVVKITARANKLVTGTVRRYDRALWLEPDGGKLTVPIKLTSRQSGVAGERAAAQVLSYGTGGQPPMGALKEVFGRAGSREAGVAATLYQYEIDPDFPPDVLEEAGRAPQTVSEEMSAGRLDLRGRTVITIDGATSKDFDDAVSLERDPSGDWLLGVHIADVSHYVVEKSALDREAWERGTSVYFADRVVPMLPEALSNGICSLNPGVDRLAISCLMTLGTDGAVKGHSLHKSILRSTERMTYEDCNVLLGAEEDGGDGVTGRRALQERYRHILPMLRDMAALAKVLEKMRTLRGSLDLDVGENAILCDEGGHPVEIRRRRQGVSEALIESFMLCANETVAKHLFDLSKPAVYRVHEKPSTEKTEGLKTMLAPFGYTILEADQFTLQKILEEAKDKPEAPIISTMVLRSLMKARYDVKNLGHFGLAAKYYCHFTSPIRRYPDLMVHRVLTLLLADGGREGKAPWEKRMGVLAQKAAVQSSEREIAAQSAEREIEKLYMAEYMSSHIGETFTAAVSGVTKHGLFVALENGVEGFLSVNDLPDDRYHYDESRMTLRGDRAEELFSFGMGLRVVCLSADPGSGQIAFALEGQVAKPPKVLTLERRTAPPREKGDKRPPAPAGRKGRRRR